MLDDQSCLLQEIYDLDAKIAKLTEALKSIDSIVGDRKRTRGAFQLDDDLDNIRTILDAALEEE